MSKRKAPVQVPHSKADEAAAMRASQGVSVGSAKQHSTRRYELRRKLREAGLPEEFIARRVEAMKVRQEAERSS